MHGGLLGRTVGIFLESNLFLWLKRKVLINAFYLTLNGTETWTLTNRWSKECKQRTTKHGKMYARQKKNNLNKKPDES